MVEMCPSCAVVAQWLIQEDVFHLWFIHTHTHTEPLNFIAGSNLQLQPEYRVCSGTDNSNRVTLRCNMSEGNPPPGPNIWLRNGIEVVDSETRVTFANSRTRLTIGILEEGDAGIYQCLSEVDNQPATTIVQSGYVNVYCKLIPNIVCVTVIGCGRPHHLLPQL